VVQDGRNLPNPYGWGERIARLLWHCAYLGLYRFVPRTFNWWHRFVLRTFGARVGQSVTLWPSAEIYFPWRLDLDDYCVIGPRVRLYSLGTIVIGKHSVVSQYSHICAGTHDYTNPRMPLIRSRVEIGHGCWICTEAFVGPGVRIGDRTVVGARAVVVSDLPQDMVCAGNPCRPIKPRVMQA
jgi:putative colanic acid biosynthesis acetyltransferase WcaF